MRHFRARQIAIIRAAVAAGRNALHSAASYEPPAFASAFVAAGGIQIPAKTASEEARLALGERLLALMNSESSVCGDADLAREIARAHTETQWSHAQADASVVGFLLVLPETVMATPAGEALSHVNHGLGPGVFRKSEIVVLQPECDGARWVPVSVHEVES